MAWTQYPPPSKTTSQFQWKENNKWNKERASLLAKLEHAELLHLWILVNRAEAEQLFEIPHDICTQKEETNTENPRSSWIMSTAPFLIGATPRGVLLRFEMQPKQPPFLLFSPLTYSLKRILDILFLPTLLLSTFPTPRPFSGRHKLLG